jgi:hypothetical protein
VCYKEKILTLPESKEDFIQNYGSRDIAIGDRDQA